MLPIENAETVLVTGVSGVLASAAAETLLRRGFAVIATTRTPGSERARHLARHGAQVVGAELGDTKSTAHLPPAHLLLHLAQTRDEALGRGDVWRANVGATCNLLDWARVHHVRRVVLSSAAQVVGGLSAAETPAGEEHGCDPRTLYERSKLAAERVAHQWSTKHSIPVVVARLAPVYGQGARWEPLERATRFAMTGILREQPRDVLVQGIHLKDAVAGLLLLVADARRLFRTYNVAGPEAMTELDLFRRVAEIAGRTSLAERIPARPVDACTTEHQGWSSARLTRELGFRARGDFQAEIFEMLKQAARRPAASGFSRATAPAHPPTMAGLFHRVRAMVSAA